MPLLTNTTRLPSLLASTWSSNNLQPSDRPHQHQPHPSHPNRVRDEEDRDGDLRNGIDSGDPLTAKGRIKKRQREKDNFDPDDADRYRYKAYHIRRAFDLFGHIPTIVNDGIKRRAKEAAGEDATHIQSDRDFETFNLIINHLDGLSDDISRLKRNPKAFRALIRKIREAADQARNNDTANLKKDIACMLTPDGASVLTVMVRGKKASSKHDRGFDNDVMGKYLCPISLDWDNNIVRDEIREGKHAILAYDWPRLLYSDCHCNLDDLELGLGRNMALVRVVKYLFTGRSAAFSETAGGKTTRSGNAALAGMKEITPRVVAYAACMLRYAISNEESWSNIDKEFNMQEFYWHVVGIFDDSDDFGKELLAWWNMKVFGTSLETTRKETPSAAVALSVLRQQREMKRAAKRPLQDSTNRQSDRRTRGNTPESEDDFRESPAQVIVDTQSRAPQHTTSFSRGGVDTQPPAPGASDARQTPTQVSPPIPHSHQGQTQTTPLMVYHSHQHQVPLFTNPVQQRTFDFQSFVQHEQRSRTPSLFHDRPDGLLPFTHNQGVEGERTVPPFTPQTVFGTSSVHRRDQICDASISIPQTTHLQPQARSPVRPHIPISPGPPLPPWHTAAPKSNTASLGTLAAVSLSRPSVDSTSETHSRTAAQQ